MCYSFHRTSLFQVFLQLSSFFSYLLLNLGREILFTKCSSPSGIASTLFHPTIEKHVSTIILGTTKCTFRYLTRIQTSYIAIVEVVPFSIFKGFNKGIIMPSKSTTLMLQNRVELINIFTIFQVFVYLLITFGTMFLNFLIHMSYVKLLIFF